jgi:hypothetical protein
MDWSVSRERRNLVSVRVPSRFNWPLPKGAEHTYCATCHCQQNVTEDKASLVWKHRSLWLTGVGEQERNNSYGPAFPCAELLKNYSRLLIIDYHSFYICWFMLIIYRVGLLQVSRGSDSALLSRMNFSNGLFLNKQTNNWSVFLGNITSVKGFFSSS